MPRGRIVILTHQHQGLHPNNGIAVIAFGLWQPAGWEIVVQQGLKDPPAADLAVLHVDLTLVPEPYLELAARYPRCLNGAVADISKRRVSQDLLARDSAWPGPVIVKTDRNHAGLPERKLALALGGWRARFADRLSRRLPPAWTGRLPGDRYPVYPGLGAVPRWVWRHPGLVVEPLQAQRHGAAYAFNQWHFLGRSSVVLTLIVPHPVAKYADRIGTLPLHDEVPPEIRRRRLELGFDYGKFDYVVTERGPRLLDANKTPWNPVPPSDERMRIMAAGLEELLA